MCTGSSGRCVLALMLLVLLPIFCTQYDHTSLTPACHQYSIGKPPWSLQTCWPSWAAQRTHGRVQVFKRADKGKQEEYQLLGSFDHEPSECNVLEESCTCAFLMRQISHMSARKLKHHCCGRRRRRDHQML